jgi:general secretion pathway protein G
MNYAEKQVKAGFTLIEIMIAVTILGILAALAGTAVFGYLARARVTSAKSTLKILDQAIVMFNADTGLYPETLRDLVKKPANEKAASNWLEGGYLKKKEVPLDPWGHKYQYRVTPDAENPFELYSYGPGGKNAKSGRIDVWKI